MEFHNHFNQRAEAERWLSTAVKLLTTRDLHGTKSFAIRARESDPRLGAAEQLIAVADTLLGSESRINNQPDYYAILQLARRTHSLELVATQYRRLALLLSPQANRFPFADQAFRLVSDAWTVLSNPSKKALYDHQLLLHGDNQQSPPPPFERHAVPQEERMQPPQQRPLAHSPPQVPANNQSEPSDSGNNFWTACPYCYHLFEYSRLYQECMLRCQTCNRAFHAVVISSPPVMDNGETNFCCWAYFPMGVSTASAKHTSNWSPFSTMFAVPLPPTTTTTTTTTTTKKKKPALGPRVYLDDDDPFLNISDPSEDSDDDWHNDKRRNKRAARPKGKPATPVRASDRIRKVTQNGMPSNGESSNKTSASTRKRAAAALGKLDLNVEFSNNELEEPPAQTMSDGNGTANGEEDNIEGIGFFEGLDEFLSSLPILNVVGDDKVKAN